MVLQDKWMQPFLKVEADALINRGYQDVGWRQVSSEAFGVPNPKSHVILVATARQSGVVDSCLFSTVRFLTVVEPDHGLFPPTCDCTLSL
jgi:site-specific DNA-cytosine methylase